MASLLDVLIFDAVYGSWILSLPLFTLGDIYHLGRTHLIGERTTENSSRLFYTIASED